MDPTEGSDDANAIQSLSDGTDAETFVSESVTNNSTYYDSTTNLPPSGVFPIAFGGETFDTVKSITRHADGSQTITGLFFGYRKLR